MSPKHLALALALTLPLSGPALAADAPAAKPAPKAAKKAVPARSAAEAAPSEDLLGRTVFQALVGDFALRQGDVELAASAWVDLARRTRDPQACARAAEILAVGRRYDLALEMVRLWLEVEPDSARARQMESSLLVLGNHLEALAPQISSMLAQEPEAIAGNLLQLNRLLARHGDKRAVQRLIDQVAAPYDSLPEAHFAMAQAALAASDEARAMRETERALALKPDWEPAALLQAQLTARTPDGGGPAVAGLAAFVQRNPAALEARLVLARLLISQRRFDEARSQLEALVRLRPESPEVIYPLAMLALQQGDSRLGRDHLEHLLRTDFPEKGNVHFFLGQLSEEGGDVDDAMAHYRLVTAGDYRVTARARLAMMLQKRGMLGEARAVLRDTQAATPAERTQLLLSESQLLRDEGQHAAAYALLEQALVHQADNLDLRYEAALLADRLGKFEVMEKHLRFVLQHKPDHAHALNALGYSLADRNIRLPEAETLINKAVALAPDDPFIADSLGWVQYRLHRLDAALATLQRAYALRPDPEIAAHLGEVLHALGRRDEARQLLDAALRANPGHEVLQPVYKKLFP